MNIRLLLYPRVYFNVYFYSQFAPKVTSPRPRAVRDLIGSHAPKEIDSERSDKQRIVLKRSHAQDV
jgi:hypothetical protein